MSTKNARPTFYGHWSAWQISIEHSLDPADGVDPVEDMEVDGFTGKIFIQPKKRQLKKPILSKTLAPTFFPARGTIPGSSRIR